MEPAISIILEALAVGTQAVAKDIASDETKRLYDWLKSCIQEKWVGKPDSETVLNAYSKNTESWSKEILAQKLEESCIHQSEDIIQQAEKLIQEVNASIQITDSQVEVNSNKQESINSSRKNSSGDTATTGSTISKDTISAGQNVYKDVRDINQNIAHNRQTRLAVLLWLLALALTGIIGYGLYLFKSGKLEYLLPKQQPPEKLEGSITSALQSVKPFLLKTAGIVSDDSLRKIHQRMSLEQVQDALGIKLIESSIIIYPELNPMYVLSYAFGFNLLGYAVYTCPGENGQKYYFGFYIKRDGSDSLYHVDTFPPDDPMAAYSNGAN